VRQGRVLSIAAAKLRDVASHGKLDEYLLGATFWAGIVDGQSLAHVPSLDANGRIVAGFKRGTAPEYLHADRAFL
jgi:hypothetical protein